MKLLQIAKIARGAPCWTIIGNKTGRHYECKETPCCGFHFLVIIAPVRRAGRGPERKTGTQG